MQSKSLCKVTQFISIQLIDNQIFKQFTSHNLFT
jgi:hypothetical protein